MKVMTVVGTRPEIIRLARVITALDQHTEHVLVHTGQNYDYELNQIFFEDLELRRPDYFLEAAGANAVETIANIIAKSDALIDEIKPDAFLVLGDTNSCLAAYSAKRRKVPIFHMEAGNRCFDQRVPEEINRKIVDHLADVNLPYSTISRDYLVREGLPVERIIKTGSPMYEVLTHYRAKCDQSQILKELGLEPASYFLVSAHREENIDSPEQFERFVTVLNSLATTFERRIIVSTHPRTRKRLDAEGRILDSRVEFLKPFGFSDYIHLQQHARVVLSDSGTISEESSILRFPALNLRQAHERPEAMEEAAVMMVGMNWSRIKEAIQVLERETPVPESPRLVRDYNVPDVSAKVVRIILSYTDYVNRVVWSKPQS